jgi:hypothetical protein
MSLDGLDQAEFLICPEDRGNGGGRLSGKPNIFEAWQDACVCRLAQSGG